MAPSLDQVSYIKVALGFLESEYGFVLRTASEKHFFFETPYCEVMVIFEVYKVYVSIGPLGQAKADVLKKGLHPARTDVKVASACLDPGFTYRRIPWNEKVNIQEELSFYANLLKKYCGRMLKGDFSEWKIIESCLKK